MEDVGIIETDNYKFSMELYEGKPFCHIEIKNWSKSIYNEMLNDLVQVESVIGSLYAFIDKSKAKERKLANMFGFMEIEEIGNGYLMRLQ